MSLTKFPADLVVDLFIVVALVGGGLLGRALVDLLLLFLLLLLLVLFFFLGEPVHAYLKLYIIIR